MQLCNADSPQNLKEQLQQKALEIISIYCSGQISSWIFAKTAGNGFIGSLSANCTDGAALPTILYGFNGTNECANSLYNETAISNEGYKLLGNFSYRCEQLDWDYCDQSSLLLNKVFMSTTCKKNESLK